MVSRVIIICIFLVLVLVSEGMVSHEKSHSAYTRAKHAIHRHLPSKLHPHRERLANWYGIENKKHKKNTRSKKKTRYAQELENKIRREMALGMRKKKLEGDLKHQKKKPKKGFKM